MKTELVGYKRVGNRFCDFMPCIRRLVLKAFASDQCGRLNLFINPAAVLSLC